jgi:hypothetical protein
LPDRSLRERPADETASGSFDRLLQETSGLALERLGEAFAGMLAKADELLRDLESRAMEREARALYAKARAVVQDRAAFQAAFAAGLRDEFLHRLDLIQSGGEGASPVDASMLELIAEDDFDESLRFRALATRVRRHCDQTLAAFDQRVAVLVGDANVGGEDNPLAPEAICDGYRRACRRVTPDLEVRRVLLRLFGDHMVDEIVALYEAANALLVEHAILPKIRYGVARSDKAPAGAASPEVAASQPPPADLFLILQQLVAKAGGSGGDAHSGGVPPLPAEELLQSLSRLQSGKGEWSVGAETASVLRELKSGLGGALGQMDAMTLDIVAMLFDQLFEDPKIPIGVKGLIGRLQIPVLKVAIADKAFFSSKSHPTRRLLESLGEIALRLPPDFDASDALFTRLEGIINELLQEFGQDTAIFDAARERLEAMLTEEEARVQRAAGAAATGAEAAERLALAKAAAQGEIGARVRGGKLPGPVLEFLVEQWLKVLLILHARRGKHSEAWKNGVEAMDQLIWSVQPHETVEDRRRLAALVPNLLKRLAAGLKLAGIGEGVREALFAELWRYHAGSGRAAAAAGAPSRPATAAPQSPAFAPHVVVKDPFGRGEVQVQDLDFTRRSGARASLPPELAIGSWVALEEPSEGRHRAVRLIFMSPRRTRYVFARDGAAKDVVVLTHAALAQRFQTGSATLLEDRPETPLFERIMGNLLGKLGAGPAQAAR